MSEKQKFKKEGNLKIEFRLAELKEMGMLIPKSQTTF